ncbi:Dirigent protein 23 [Linum grandiflorum]
MGLSYNFLDGPYNGSSITVVGKNPAGVFRMARGYALLKTVSLTKDGNAVVHYNVTVHTPPADCN